MAAAQRAVAELCEQEFAKLFGTEPTVDWRNAWLKCFNDNLALEMDARAAAQDFARYSLVTAKAKATATLQRHGADPTNRSEYLDQIQRLPPVARLLFAYLMHQYSDEPFLLDGENVEVIKLKPRKDGRPWRNLRSMTIVNDKQAAIVTRTGKRHLVEYVVKRERLQSGVKWERTGDAGALADYTTLDGFIIANFERLSYEDGPAEPFSMDPSSPRKYASFYATDRELAMFSVLLCPTSVSVKPADVTHGTSARTLLDQHRHNVSNKRKHLGYLHTTATEQILRERAWGQPTGAAQRGARRQKDPTKVTEKERREWIKLQMQRPPIHLQTPPILPVVPWPR